MKKRLGFTRYTTRRYTGYLILERLSRGTPRARASAVARSVAGRMAPSSLLRIGTAVLLLGVYHVLVQLFSSAAAPPPCSHSLRGGSAPRAGTPGYLTTGVPQQPLPGVPQQPLPAVLADAATAAAAGLLGGAQWVPPPHSNLQANAPGGPIMAGADPATTTLHFTFGSGTMMQFLRNWRHYIIKAGIGPAIVGAADADMLAACTAEGIGAIGIVQDLDVWTYEKMKGTSNVQGEASGCGKYYRHNKNCFLELGLVKAAFLWEILSLGFDVLISDPTLTLTLTNPHPYEPSPPLTVTPTGPSPYRP